MLKLENLFAQKDAKRVMTKDAERLVGMREHEMSTIIGEDIHWLLDQIEGCEVELTRLRAANESLSFQLQDRIRLEHDHNAYIESEKERCEWIRKCANQARRIAKLEAALKEVVEMEGCTGPCDSFGICEACTQRLHAEDALQP